MSTGFTWSEEITRGDFATRDLLDRRLKPTNLVTEFVFSLWLFQQECVALRGYRKVAPVDGSEMPACGYLPLVSRL